MQSISRTTQNMPKAVAKAKAGAEGPRSAMKGGDANVDRPQGEGLGLGKRKAALSAAVNGDRRECFRHYDFGRSFVVWFSDRGGGGSEGYGRTSQSVAQADCGFLAALPHPKGWGYRCRSPGLGIHILNGRIQVLPTFSRAGCNKLYACTHLEIKNNQTAKQKVRRRCTYL